MSDRQIREFTKRAIKKGLKTEQVISEASKKFNQKFMAVNGHIYREDNSALHVVVAADYIQRHTQTNYVNS